VGVVTEKNAVIFILAQMLPQKVGEGVNMRKYFRSAEPFRQCLCEVSVTGKLEKAGKGFFIEVFGKAEAHLVWFHNSYYVLAKVLGVFGDPPS